VSQVRLVRSPLEPWSTWFSACGLMLPEPDAGAQCNDLGLVYDAAAAGFGVALVRLDMGAAWFDSGRLLRLSTRSVPSPNANYICWKPGTMERWECAAFVDWLAALPLQKVVVLHANHANELDASVDAACAALRQAGVTLLNQSVLLRGINDDADALVTLSERLFAAGVLPYYLHQLDRVQGTAHFEVDDARARALVEDVRQRLPGFLVPRLVREVAGDASKRPL